MYIKIIIYLNIKNEFILEIVKNKNIHYTFFSSSFK